MIDAGYDGVIPVYPDADTAAFICGTAASIDFNQQKGRITFAYKGQSGMTAQVTDETIATDLATNGYNFYGAYATATERFVMLQKGSMPGQWSWIDPYVNQIYLNSQLQLALMSLMTQVKSLPYNNQGYGLLRAACQDPIDQALNFGSIRPGIPLSNAQRAEINADADADVATTIETQGYYLQILPATTQTRGERGSPPMTLWYTDGGSIQQINLASIDVM